MEWDTTGVSIIEDVQSKKLSASYLHRVVSMAFGIILWPLLGLFFRAFIPIAMSLFGTVVPGVGTIHAPLASGGIAAWLQSSSAALVSPKAAMAGGSLVAASGIAMADMETRE